MSEQTKIDPFTIKVQSGETAARQALAGVLGHLEPLNLDIEEAGTIELVLAEALNNIVEHAYPQDDAPGLISVGCSASESGLAFQIKDNGRPMPDGKTPLGQAVNLDVDIQDLPEGGFGWFLIRDLAKDVEYRRTDDTNVLKLRLAIATAA